MKKLFIMSLLVFTAIQVNAQSLCDDDVVENLTADIQFSAMQVEMSWDFDFPFTCGLICPPGLVFYEVEYEFGMQYFGPNGPITWGATNVTNIIRDDTDAVHSLTVPITSKFEHFRYRVKITTTPACTNWDGWVETSIWD